MSALLPLAPWVPILDGDPTAAAIYNAHYSSERSRARRIASGALLIVGPGEKLVLSTPGRGALFAWRRERFRKDGQAGVECAVFANHSSVLSSELIIEAEAIADRYWPGDRHFTFVNSAATSGRRGRRSRPGECFRRAGWLPCGESKRGLIILESVVNLRRLA